MDWYIERDGCRTGPYAATEIAARVSSGAVPPTVDVVSTDGSMRMTAAALVAASAASPGIPSPPQALLAPPPLTAPSQPGWWKRTWRIARQRLGRFSGMEWAIGTTIIAGYTLLVIPATVDFAAAPILANWILIAVDARRHRWSRLALSKAPLAKLERWTTSTWIVSIGVLWPFFAPVYLFKRRRLIACVAEVDSRGAYASQAELRESRRGVAGAAIAAEQAPRDSQDLLLQTGCLIVAVLVVAAVCFAPRGATNQSEGEESAQTSSAEVDAIAEVMNAHARIQKMQGGDDVFASIAALDEIDLSACPSDYREAFRNHREAVRNWATRLRTSQQAAFTPMTNEQRAFFAIVEAAARVDSDKQIKATYAEALRVAKTYGVEYK
jgi:hypothetical protein